MMDKENRATMLPKSSSQKTLRAAMQEERTSMVSRLLSPEAAVSNLSFRVYYGVASAGSVPFVWESAPGTPKNDAVSDTKLPPLTPPPSYYYSNRATAKTKFVKSQSSKKLLSSSKPTSFVQSIIPKQLRRSHTMPSRSPPSSPDPPPFEDGVQYSRRSRLLVSQRSSFSSTSRGDKDEEGGGASSPTSMLCFRARHSSSGVGRMHGLLASVRGG
jgi:hypothetical protein